MTSIGTGYDLSNSTFSPDGRVFQVEYAYKAVENSGICIGLRTKDGVVLALQKIAQSKLLKPHANKQIAIIDRHAGLVTTGLIADGRHLINRAREEAQNWRDLYRDVIPGPSLADRIGQYVQAYTLYSSVRPFGVTSLLGCVDDEGPHLYMIEPSGMYWGYFGAAAGKGRQEAKNEIEKLELETLTLREAVNEIVRIMYNANDEAREKDFDVEISWVGKETGGKHEFVPEDIIADAVKLAQEFDNENDEEDVGDDVMRDVGVAEQVE